MTVDPVTHSLEIAASRCDDLTPLVYARLFREAPEVEQMFRNDSGLVRGEMLARALEAILDLADGGDYGANFVASEATTHDGYDVPRDKFVRFFRVIAESVRECVGADWSPQMDTAWRALLARIESSIAIETPDGA